MCNLDCDLEYTAVQGNKTTPKLDHLDLGPDCARVSKHCAPITPSLLQQMGKALALPPQCPKQQV